MGKLFSSVWLLNRNRKIKLPYVLMTIVLLSVIIFVIYIPSIVGSSHEDEKVMAEEKMDVLLKIKNELTVDLDASEVKTMLGENFTEVNTMSEEVWRYDFGAQEEYSYAETNEFADLDGILMVTWTSNCLLPLMPVKWKLFRQFI
ncbi:MAG: hypothetical protein LRY73_06015 [Bacillus sp. (in: Bacteria)]|nr:hypothetical protein [Bacillus sp. (in: firmicutes)]